MSQLIAVILHYKYLALFPLAAFEGPIISLLVGFLIYTGHLEFLPAYGILILGDIIPDTFYYYIGRIGDKKNLMQKYATKSGVVSSNLQLIDKLWRHHGKKTMFLSKLAYGLSTPFLISAGLVGMPFKRFISYTIPISLFQYGLLLLAGYLLGHSYTIAIGYIKYTSILVAIVLVLFVAGYYFVSRYAKRQILNLEKEEAMKK